MKSIFNELNNQFQNRYQVIFDEIIHAALKSERPTLVIMPATPDNLFVNSMSHTKSVVLYSHSDMKILKQHIELFNTNNTSLQLAIDDYDSIILSLSQSTVKQLLNHISIKEIETNPLNLKVAKHFLQNYRSSLWLKSSYYQTSLINKIIQRFIEEPSRQINISYDSINFFNYLKLAFHSNNNESRFKFDFNENGLLFTNTDQPHQIQNSINNKKFSYMK